MKDPCSPSVPMRLRFFLIGTGGLTDPWNRTAGRKSPTSRRTRGFLKRDSRDGKREKGVKLSFATTWNRRGVGPHRGTRLFVRSNGWAAVIIRRRKGYKWEVGSVGQRMVGCCGNTTSGGSAAVRLVCSLEVKPTLYPRPCRSGPFLAPKAGDIFLHVPRKY